MGRALGPVRNASSNGGQTYGSTILEYHPLWKPADFTHYKAKLLANLKEHAWVDDGPAAPSIAGMVDSVQPLGQSGDGSPQAELLAAVFRGVDIGLCVVEVQFDQSGKATNYRFTETNDAFARLMGLSDAKGKLVTEAQPGVNPKWITAFGEVARTGIYYRVENHAPSGRWYDIQAFRVGEPEQGKVAILFADVTARKTAEETLRSTATALVESEARLELAIDAGGLAVWELDVLANRIAPSRALNRLYGFPEDASPTLDDYLTRYAPGELERVRQLGAEMTARGDSSLETEILHLWPDGTQKWLLIRAHIVSEATGQRVFGVVVDVTRQKQAEERLRLLTNELAHRIKNMLAMVSSIASQTFRGSELHQKSQAFQARLQALSEAQSLVSSRTSSDAVIEDVVRSALTPFDAERILVAGPPLLIGAKAALSLALAVNELGTNAVKYGALSKTDGRVSITWTLSKDQFVWVWREEDGPAVVPPARHGFGSVLIDQVLAQDFNGQVHLDYLSTGLVCTLEAPRSGLELD